MSDDYGIQGLNGPEIKANIKAKFAKVLDGDCSLRPQDSYSRGFSAKITYHIEAYGLDKEVIEGTFEVGTLQDDPDAEVVEGELEIPQEEDVSAVREENRMAEDGPEEEFEDAPDSLPTSPVVSAKRKYTRKLKLASPSVIGGAEEFTE